MDGDTLVRKSIPCTFVLIQQLYYKKGDEHNWLLKKKSKETMLLLQLERNFLQTLFLGKERHTEIKGCLLVELEKSKGTLIELLFSQLNSIIAHWKKCKSTLLEGK
jgi:hypothetical protein